MMLVSHYCVVVLKHVIFGCVLDVSFIIMYLNSSYNV